MAKIEKNVKLKTAQKRFFKACSLGWLQTSIATAIRNGASIHEVDEDGLNAIEVALKHHRWSTAIVFIYLDVEITDMVREYSRKPQCMHCDGYRLTHYSNYIAEAIELKEKSITNVREYLSIGARDYNFIARQRDFSNIVKSMVEGASNREYMSRDKNKKIDLKPMEQAFRPTREELERIESGDLYDDWDLDYEGDLNYE